VGLGSLALGGVLLLIVRPAKGSEAAGDLPKVPPVSGRVVVALPTKDFDVTEVVVPWNTLRGAGVEVVFATADGEPGACDPRLLTGVIFGQLGALPENVELYKELIETAAFKSPIRYADLEPGVFHGLLLPGGHAPGMKQYLESEELQDKARAFLVAGVPVGAICHGVLVLARAKDPATGHSVLRGRRVTALTGLQERLAYALTFWKLGRYYRTYPAYVQDETSTALGEEGSFEAGPLFASYENPFHVTDRNLVTARWPGDAQGFASAFLAKVSARVSSSALTEGAESAQR
jgi:putative intracellular protease/amidase